MLPRGCSSQWRSVAVMLRQACFWEKRDTSDSWLWPSLLGMLSWDVSLKHCACSPWGGYWIGYKAYLEWQSRKMERTWVLTSDVLSYWVRQPQGPSPHGLLVCKIINVPIVWTAELRFSLLAAESTVTDTITLRSYLPEETSGNVLLWTFPIHLPTSLSFYNLIYFVVNNMLIYPTTSLYRDLPQSFSWLHRILYRDVYYQCAALLDPLGCVLSVRHKKWQESHW